MSTSRTTMAATIQAGTTRWLMSMTSVPSTRTLSAIGSGGEPSGDVLPCFRAGRPSNQSVDIATQKTPVAQYA